MSKKNMSINIYGEIRKCMWPIFTHYITVTSYYWRLLWCQLANSPLHRDYHRNKINTFVNYTVIHSFIGPGRHLHKTRGRWQSSLHFDANKHICRHVTIPSSLYCPIYKPIWLLTVTTLCILPTSVSSGRDGYDMVAPRFEIPRPLHA
jgi:hypothetical protein